MKKSLIVFWIIILIAIMIEVQIAFFLAFSDHLGDRIAIKLQEDSSYLVVPNTEDYF